MRFGYPLNVHLLLIEIERKRRKIHKVMTDEEVRNILIENGYTPIPRKDGDIDLSKYGF